jgi:murein L,D-transpeptidase YcbB/YkuD
MRFLIAFIFITQTSFLSAASVSASHIAEHIEEYISAHTDSKNRVLVRSLYATSGYKPFWVASDKRIADLIRTLQDIKYNYKEKPFDNYDIKRLLYRLDNESMSLGVKMRLYAIIDIKLTNSFVSLVRFVRVGDVDWHLVKRKLKDLRESDNIKANWEFNPKSMPSDESIYRAIANGNLSSYLDSLISMKNRYMGLISILKKYQYAKSIKVAYGSDLKVGMSDGRVHSIKEILKNSGDLPQDAYMSNKFDTLLEQSVISYQKRHNLPATGIVDRVTTYYMNQPANKKLKAVIVNLDKTKLYPRSFEDEHVEINLPDYQLRYYRDGMQLFKTNIVIGKISRPTPMFHDYIKFAVVNPTWTIPDSLIKRDLIHVLKQNPNYLEENNIYVNGAFGAKKLNMEKLFSYEGSKKRVPYSFVQHAGKTNALGRVKFMFPNRYAVYLHDTDNKYLLDRRYRIYSSGCMRVKNPFTLMKYLMGSKYNESKMQKILDSLKPTTVHLPRKVPIHIIYFTVYTENGKAYFKNDIYQYDKIIEESTEGNRKETFTMPKNRLIVVDEKGNKSPYDPEKKSTIKYKNLY